MNNQEFSVKYKHGNNVVGSTSSIHLDDNPAYLTEFVDQKTAEQFYQKFQSEIIPNFGNVKWMHKKKLAVLVDEGYTVFDASKKLNFDIWSYNSIGTDVISMGYPFVKLFNGVFKGLKALYSKEFPHRNLRRGITYSKDLDVKLFNVGKRKGSIGDGVRKDLNDLMKLVLEVIDNNPHDPRFKTPDCVSLFRGFYGLFDTITHSNIAEKWEFEFYFFSKNPIFADETDRIVLLRKFVNLYKMLGPLVETSITLDTPPTAMPQWWFNTRPGDYIHEIVQYHLNNYIAGVGGRKSIIGFCLACLRHKQKRQGKGMDEVVVEASLLDTFPDLLPKLYYEFVQKLAWTPFPNPTWYGSYVNYFQEADPKN